MPAVITLDQFNPQKIGGIALITGSVAIDAYDAGGVDFSAIGRYFSDERLFSILFTGISVSGDSAYNIAEVGTVTFTAANPCQATVSTTLGAGNFTGKPILFRTSGDLLTGLSVNTVYWRVRTAAQACNLAPTYADAVAGTNLIATSGSDSGTHKYFDVLNPFPIYGLEYDQATKKLSCLKGAGLEPSTGAVIAARFMALGQGGL